MTLQQTKDFLEGDNTYGLDFDDKVLSKNEITYLQQRLSQCDKDKTAKDMIAAVNGLGKPSYEQKLSQFKTTPGNLWDKYNACSLTNEDIAMFQFLHNLKNPTKRISIDGLLGQKTYTAMFGYESGVKYDIQITKNNLRKVFPENGKVKLTDNFIDAWAKAIGQKNNPFVYEGKSYMWRYDTLISITANKEKYIKTQDAKNIAEYQNIVGGKKLESKVSNNAGFDNGNKFMGSDGNIIGLDYDFENATLAQQCNTVITKKMNSLLKTCKDKKISLASETPFSKIYTGSGHFQFDGIYQNGDTYEVDPVFSTEDMGGSNSVLYKIMDKNEDAFLQHLNNRWNELYNKHVVDTQKNMFIPGLDINWGKNTEKVKNYLNSIMKKAEEFNKKYPTSETEPFKNDDSFDDQEIYFAGLDRVTRYEAKTGTPYTSLEKKELGVFSDAIKKQLGVENIMNDDDNVKKVVKWLNNTWMETHVLKQVATKEEVASLISKDALKKKLENDDDLTPKELQALQYYENQDFTRAMNDKYFGTKESYLSLYTRDEGLVKGLGEKTLEHTKKIADAIVAMNPEYAITILQKLHAQYDDERHPDSAITILKQFTGHFGQKIYEGLTQKIQKDPKNKEKYQKQLLGLAKLVTDRNGDIDSDLKDIGLAKKIMNDLMPTVIDTSKNNKERDDQCEKKFNNNKDKVMKIFSTNPQFQKLLGNSNNFSWDSLKTFEQKQYVNTLVEYVIRFGDPKSDTELQSLSPELQAKKIVERIQALTQISMKGLMKSFTDFADAGGKYSDDLQLTGFQKEVYDIYRDMMGIGKLNLSDENADTTIEYSKMAAVIVVAIAATIAVTVATGGTGTGAAVALSRSAVGSMAAGAAAGSLTGYLADYMINQRQAESNEIFMKDMFSTLAIDVATAGPFALVPGLGPLLSKYPKLANIFVKIGNTIGSKAVSGAEMVTSAAVSGYAEQWRQQYIMGNEQVTFDQLVQQIGMGLALPAVFQGGPKLLSYLHTKGQTGKIKSGLTQSIGYVDEILKKKLLPEEKKFFTNLKQQYINNANQLEQVLSPKTFAKQKEGDKVIIVWGSKKHALQKTSTGDYIFVSNNGGFVKGEKVIIKENDGILTLTRNSGKEIGVQDWSLVQRKSSEKTNTKNPENVLQNLHSPVGNEKVDASDAPEIVLDLGVNDVAISEYNYENYPIDRNTKSFLELKKILNGSDIKLDDGRTISIIGHYGQGGYKVIEKIRLTNTDGTISGPFALPIPAHLSRHYDGWGDSYYPGTLGKMEENIRILTDMGINTDSILDKVYLPFEDTKLPLLLLQPHNRLGGEVCNISDVYNKINNGELQGFDLSHISDQINILSKNFVSLSSDSISFQIDSKNKTIKLFVTDVDDVKIGKETYKNEGVDILKDVLENHKSQQKISHINEEIDNILLETHENELPKNEMQSEEDVSLRQAWLDYKKDLLHISDMLGLHNINSHLTVKIKDVWEKVTAYVIKNNFQKLQSLDGKAFKLHWDPKKLSLDGLKLQQFKNKIKQSLDKINNKREKLLRTGLKLHNNEVVVQLKPQEIVDLNLGDAILVFSKQDDGTYKIEQKNKNGESVVLKEGEQFLLGRNHNAFSFDNTVSKEHCTITISRDGSVIIKDHSLNGMNIKKSDIHKVDAKNSSINKIKKSINDFFDNVFANMYMNSIDGKMEAALAKQDISHQLSDLDGLFKQATTVEEKDHLHYAKYILEQKLQYIEKYGSRADEFFDRDIDSILNKYKKNSKDILEDQSSNREFKNSNGLKDINQYSTFDKAMLGAIRRGESLRGMINNAKRTHRTGFDSLCDIVKSGLLGSNQDRGIQFWGGIGAGYGEVTIIMKDQVMQVGNPAKGIIGSVNPDNPRMHYFFGGKALSWNEYQKQIDFAEKRGESANKEMPYLSIGGKNVDANYGLQNQVGINNVQAVMLPAHLKNDSRYQEIIIALQKKGIDVVELATQQDILDYTGTSIIDAYTRGSKYNQQQIKSALNKRYPDIVEPDMQVKQFLIETGRIKLDDINRSLQEIAKKYYDDFAIKNGLSRGSSANGQYENYASKANFNIEEKAYFSYLLYMKNNPSSSGMILQQDEILGQKIDHGSLNHTTRLVF